jgi:hypothetical protein
MNMSESRELGVLGAKLQALEDKLEEHRNETRENRVEVKNELRALNTSVQSILDKMNGWRGGWKAMAVVGAIASAITTFVLQIVPLFHK